MTNETDLRNLMPIIRRATSLEDLIEKLEQDTPTNIFTINEQDKMTVLGKINEIIAMLSDLQATIASSDAQSAEALANSITALRQATQALEASATAVESSNNALGTANTALGTANSAIDTARLADVNASDALEQALDAVSIAQQALDQVVQGLGTKVYNYNGQLLVNAKFEGADNINIDMSETDPEKFVVSLDDAFINKVNTSGTDIENLKTKDEDLQEQVSQNTQNILLSATNITELYTLTQNLQTLIEQLENSKANTNASNIDDSEAYSWRNKLKTTQVLVGGTVQETVNFDSDPQQQLNNRYVATMRKAFESIDGITAPGIYNFNYTTQSYRMIHVIVYSIPYAVYMSFSMPMDAFSQYCRGEGDANTFFMITANAGANYFTRISMVNYTAFRLGYNSNTRLMAIYFSN